jgi:hypothetical protein
MKLYRITITRTSTPLVGIPDEAYVSATSAQNALSAVVAALGPANAAKVLAWNVDLVSSTFLTGS